MTIRYIVRPPQILTTPRKLKEVLDARRTVNGAISRRIPTLDWVHDLFLYYPRLPNEVSEYTTVREFFSKDKGEQRNHLAEYVKTPNSYISNTYVVRPRRHMGGQDFVVTEFGQTEINPYTHYVSPLFPKVKEYRVIFLKGVPIITLRKVFSQATPDPTLPWNHAQGATFNTIAGGHTASSLRHTSCISDLLNVPVVQHAHLIGVDVMMDTHNNYAVCEINFCPSISIESNLNVIRDHLLPQA